MIGCILQLSVRGRYCSWLLRFLSLGILLVPWHLQIVRHTCLSASISCSLSVAIFIFIGSSLSDNFGDCSDSVSVLSGISICSVQRQKLATVTVCLDTPAVIRLLQMTGHPMLHEFLVAHKWSPEGWLEWPWLDYCWCIKTNSKILIVSLINSRIIFTGGKRTVNTRDAIQN